MKTYSTQDVINRRTNEGLMADEWVSAEVAQGLYAALRAMREDGIWTASGEWVVRQEAEDMADDALAAADGEDV